MYVDIFWFWFSHFDFYFLIVWEKNEIKLIKTVGTFFFFFMCAGSSLQMARIFLRGSWEMGKHCFIRFILASVASVSSCQTKIDQFLLLPSTFVWEINLENVLYLLPTISFVFNSYSSLLSVVENSNDSVCGALWTGNRHVRFKNEGIKFLWVLVSLFQYWEKRIKQKRKFEYFRRVSIFIKDFK